MRPLNTDLFYKNPFQVEYCPKYSEDSKKFQSIIPNLLADGKPYMPTFSFNYELPKLIVNEDRYRQDHLK